MNTPEEQSPAERQLRLDNQTLMIARALGHRLRLEATRYLRANQLGSPKQISLDLEEPLGNIAYHMKILRDTGVVAIVARAKRRGAVEHLYELKGRNLEATLEVLDLMEGRRTLTSITPEGGDAVKAAEA